MQYYIISPAGTLMSGPHAIASPKASLPDRAFVTTQAPPVPGEGEAVYARPDGGWRVGPEPAPVVRPVVGPDQMHRSEFAMHLLTDGENDIWIALVDEAEQTAPASRTEAQKAILRAWRHFTLAEYIHRTAPETQGGVYLLYLSGVFGPPFDGEGAPTTDQLTAIARADRVSAFLPPE